MIITRYYPNYMFDMDLDLKEYHFSSLKELLNIDWVKKFGEGEEFYRYSVSDNRLMAEYKNGAVWWVMGHLSNPEKIDLPKWSPPPEKLQRNKDAERLREKNVELATREIRVMTVNEFNEDRGVCLVGGLECEVSRIEQRVDSPGSMLTVKANFHIECSNEYQVEWLGEVYEAKCIETETGYAGKSLQVEAKFRLSEDLIKAVEK